MNLLNVRWIRGCLGSRWFPILPQLIMLVVFGLLVMGGIGVNTDDASFAKVLRNTNLANLVVWSYWWLLIIIAIVALFLTTSPLLQFPLILRENDQILWKAFYNFQYRG